jgi:CDP-diacylglycerol---glycerol-3-phosphate 3-phosphatidyltransferase
VGTKSLSTDETSARGKTHSAGVLPLGSKWRDLPNTLTLVRAGMAVIFFVVLTRWRWQDSQAQANQTDWWLLLAAGLFIAAALTDVLDGYLARRWGAESAFGRIMDPFADKLLVLGGFVFLASADWWLEFQDPSIIKLSGHGMQISGVYPWMVVVILGRELLVTSIRGVLEAQGVKFPADRWGKMKMLTQSIAIPTALIAPAITTVVPTDFTASWLSYPWGRQIIDLTVRVMLVVTILSVLPYCWRARNLLRAQGNSQ